MRLGLNSASVGALAFALLASASVAEAAEALDAASTSTELSGVTVTGVREAYVPQRTRSATRTDTLIENVPQSISIVTEELIRDQSMQSMADVVRYVPGVTMGQGEGHRDAPTIRGNSSTADFFVDGVRDDVQYFRDVYNAERIEVLKGPSAMIFGRGGGGGVINRVMKAPAWSPQTIISLEAGSFDHRRATLDVNQPMGDEIASRVIALYQDSGSHRDYVEVERWGMNPTLTFAPTDSFAVRLSYEHFEDERTVDRGVPSFNGAPATRNTAVYFGSPEESFSTAQMDAFRATVEYVLSSNLTLRNHTAFSSYDKFYQNVFPGAVNATRSQVSLAAYNTATSRENLFNQTDLVWKLQTGSMAHTVLLGAEFGKQETDNLRETGYFGAAGSTVTSVSVPFLSPTLFNPAISFRQSATDANNFVTAKVGAVFLQEQIELSRRWQLIGGLRFDRFELDYRNNRDGVRLSRTDEVVSPRVGLVFKPLDQASLYVSYSKSFLPSAGDQFASLTATSRTLEPEEFQNYEVGGKWKLRPDLLLTGALYRLDRDNTTARDPLDAARIVQTGSQRSEGFELGLAGRVNAHWQVAAGYSYQDVKITSETTAARKGQRVPLTPRHSFSLWNKVQVLPRLALGVGVTHQSEMFTGIDNTVSLPAFTRFDSGAFFDVNESITVQANVENLFDKSYFPTAHSNNNITPGSPRAVRISVHTRF